MINIKRSSGKGRKSAWLDGSCQERDGNYKKELNGFDRKKNHIKRNE